MYRKVPWQRNFLNIPAHISVALKNLASDLFVVAQTKKVPLADIQSQTYAHLGLTIQDGNVIAPETPVLPLRQMGKWSVRNQDGWENKRTDLPKITKTFTWESPNFGDGSRNGYHTHHQDREVYPVEFFEPRGNRIAVEVLKQPEAGRPFALIKFSVDSLLDRTHRSIEYDLFLCVNMLQENAGATGVFASDASREDYIGTIALDWEVFPPGTAQAVIAAMGRGRKASTQKQSGIIANRVALFESLKPKHYLKGHGGFSAYVGAEFDDDLVVFENLNYGNALYVLYENWEGVSRRSRIDLIRGTSEVFDRFLHTDGWEDRFRGHMKNEIKKRRYKKR